MRHVPGFVIDAARAVPAAFAVCALVLAAPAAAQNQAIDSPEQLMERLARVMETGDADRLDRLYYWEGVDPDHARALRESFPKRFFDCSGSPSRVIPGRSEADVFVRGDYRYTTNLPIEGRIHIECANGKWTNFQVPYGQRHGQFFLVNVAREAEPVEAPESDR